MRLRTLLGLGGITGIALAALLGAAPAQAHNAFVSSSPAAGSVVTEQPGTIVVTTSDALLDLGDTPRTYLQVRGPGTAQLYYGDGCDTVDGASITMPVQLGEPGEYSIAWGAVSADGHEIASAANGGDIVFTWQPADGQDLVGGSSVPPTCGELPAESATPVPGETEAAPVAPEKTATSAPAADADDGAANAAADIVWIGAGLGVFVVVAVVILLVVRSRTRAAGPESPASEPRNSATEL